MNWIDKRIVKRVLLVLAAVILVGGVAHAVCIDVFNKTEHTATGADASQATYLRFDDRNDTTSKWVKRDFELNGKTVDLQAQTVDGTLVNNSDDTVASWEATINIEGDCFINNAWVGTVEIHQYVGTDYEKTQTLDLRSYDLGDVELDYLYDGDLLIPLAKGDRIVYHPSEADEFGIAPKSELTMGMIFYYLDDLNLADHSVSYYYHRDFTYGIDFIVLVALAIIWVLLLASAEIANISYKRAMREADLRKSGLASMSSIYSVISFINLANDELIPVYADVATEEILPQGTGANEKLRNIFAQDTAPAYRTEVLKFIDTETLPARLAKESIALEYVSKAYGWSQVRFFAVDRKEGQPLERVLLTIEDINDEKREKKRFEERSAQIELESSARSALVIGVSNGMRPSVRSVDDLAKRIMNATDDGQIRDWSRQIRTRTNLISHLLEGAIDSSSLDGNSLGSASAEYALADLISNTREIAEMLAVDKELEIDVEISPSVPARLRGDGRRIERVLIGLLAYMIHSGNIERTIKLSIYGTKHEKSEHMLFSVKTSGPGLDEEAARTFADFANSIENYGAQAISDDIRELEGVAIMLMYMGSKLQLVNEPGEGFELYFEIEQKLADNLSTGENSRDGKPGSAGSNGN